MAAIDPVLITSFHEALLAVPLDLDHVGSLLDRDTRVLNCPNAQGLLPISIAAYQSDVELIRLFASHGADLEVTMQAKGETPLLIACQRGSLYCVHALADCGANVNATDLEGQTAVHQAAKSGAVHIIHYLNQVYRLSLSEQDKDGSTPLHLAVKSGNVDVVKYLLKKNCDARTANNHGSTPLSVAAQLASRTIARCLIMSSDDNLLDLCNKNGHSPLYHAKNGTTERHRKLAKEMVRWTNERLSLRRSWLNRDIILWLFHFLLIGNTLNIGLLLYCFILQPLLAVIGVLVVVISGFTWALKDHRLSHPLGWQNPATFGGLIYGIVHTLVCSFVVIFPHQPPISAIMLINVLILIYLLWKLETTDPGFDKTGKLNASGQPMTIMDIAKQSRIQSIQYSFCIPCEIVIPERTKHCRLCQHCCNDFDHHCLWIMTCVGLNNHRTFVLFLISLSLANWSFVFISVTYLISIKNSYNPVTLLMYGFTNHHWVFYLIICNLCTGLFVLMNLFYQLSVISLQETMYFDFAGIAAYNQKRNRNTSFLTKVRILFIFFFRYNKWVKRNEPVAIRTA